MTNELLFKVKCIYIDNDCLTVGKEYDVVEVDDGFYKVKNDSGEFWWYYNNRFETVDRESNPKDKQEFSIGDKVVVNKISDGYVSHADKNVKVGDTATVTIIANFAYELCLSNPNWEHDWWFSKDDVSLVADNNPLDDNSLDYHLLSHQEAVQAVVDGKELEIQYADGTWNSMSPVNTTLHQLTTLNFRLKPSKEDKRKAVIKKLLENKVAVLCKCWDGDVAIREVIVAITKIDDGCTYPYMNNCLFYENAFAINDNGDEITNV